MGKSTWKDELNNLLDYSTWVIGTSGDQPGFGRYGTIPENNIVSAPGPFGEDEAIWEAIKLESDGSSGGWESNWKNVDPTKIYRLTTFCRRESAANSTAYLSTYSSETLVDSVVGNSVNYLLQGKKWPLDDGWQLIVGYIIPNAMGVQPSVVGRRYSSKGVPVAINRDTAFTNTVAQDIKHRFINVGGTISSGKQWACRPRLEIMNGSEPPVATAWAAMATFSADSSTDLFTPGGTRVRLRVSETEPLMNDGDYWIDYSGDKNRVFLKEGGTITELPIEGEVLPSVGNSVIRSVMSSVMVPAIGNIGDHTNGHR